MTRSRATPTGWIGPRHGIRFAGALAAAMALSGCGAVHFYSAENDKTASEAKAASDQLELATVIAQERQNQARLLTHEISVVSDFATARRDTALLALLEDRSPFDGGSDEALSDTLRRLVNARLAKLVGQTDPKALLNLVAELRAAEENIAHRAMGFRRDLGVPPPRCSGAEESVFDVTNEMVSRFSDAVVKIGKDITTDQIERTLKAFEKHCGRYQSTRKALLGVSEEVGSSTAAWASAQSRLRVERHAADEALKNYKAALDRIQEATKSAKGDPAESVQKKLDSAIETARAVLEVSSEIPAFAQLAFAEEQIAQIDLLLEAAAQDSLDPSKLEGATPETKDAVLVAALLPSIAARGAAIAALAEAPPINALLLEKERLLALKLDAERTVRRANERVVLLKRKSDALIAEVDALVRSLESLDWALRRTGGQALGATDLLKAGLDSSTRRHLIQAVAFYLNTFTGPRRLVHETEYRLIDVSHAQALDRSETSLRLWQAAIKQPVTALAAYHEAGIKQEDIIELLKAAGLFAIGAGANN